MVFVTGGTGLLGTHLIMHLHGLGIHLRAIYRSAIPAVVANKAEWVQADVLDVIALEAAMTGANQVYHCAGLVSYLPADKEMLHKVNVEGTANVVNVALALGVQKLVHVSSVAALGRGKNSEGIDEQLQWTPKTSNSMYGHTKFLGEMEVWRGIGEGLDAVIVNPSIIFGEHGDWNNGSMRMFKTVQGQFPWYSMGITGFVDADDVVKIMALLMDGAISGERYVVSAENMRFRDVFFMIADAFGVKRPTKLVTPFKAGVVWRLANVASWFSGKPPFITKETARTSLLEAHFSNAKLLKALPNFRFSSLEETISRICKHYAAHPALPMQ